MALLDRDGVKVHYEVHGTASDRVPLLLSHGFEATSVMWAANLAALGAQRTVITWDLRGHGHSDAPADQGHYSEAASVADMAAILDACDVTRAAIGGLSLGGYLSLAFHLSHPDRTAALLLFDTGPGYKQDAGRAEWNRMTEGLAADFERRGLDALPGSPEVSGGRHDAAGLARAARGILVQHDDRVIASLPTIAVPTLVVVGEHDRQFLAAADYLAAKVPGATKVVIPGAGHASNIDQPDAFNQAVIDFLDQASVS